MTTLKDIWESKKLSHTQAAGLADISVGTLYKINRKESVKKRTLLKVLDALKISEQEYEQLEAGQS